MTNWAPAALACRAWSYAKSTSCTGAVPVSLAAPRVALRSENFPANGALESSQGADAYAFLLRFAAGLESKLVAETEIFGQIKQAWREFSERDSPLARQLSPWVQLLFQDAKAVRAQYLANLGSASYGSPTRRVLGAAGTGWSTPPLGGG